MNKLILVLVLAMVGCATQQATRQALNCQSEPIKDSSALFIGGSRVKDEITCKTVQVPVAPKAVPLQVNSDLVK